MTKALAVLAALCLVACAQKPCEDLPDGGQRCVGVLPEGVELGGACTFERYPDDTPAFEDLSNWACARPTNEGPAPSVGPFPVQCRSAPDGGGKYGWYPIRGCGADAGPTTVCGLVNNQPGCWSPDD